MEYMRELGILRERQVGFNGQPVMGSTGFSGAIEPSLAKFIVETPEFLGAIEGIATGTSSEALEPVKALIEGIEQKRKDDYGRIKQELDNGKKQRAEMLNGLESKIMAGTADEKVTGERDSLLGQVRQITRTEKILDTNYNNISLAMRRVKDALEEKYESVKKAGAMTENAVELPLLPGKEKEPGLEKPADVQVAPKETEEKSSPEGGILSIFAQDTTPPVVQYSPQPEGIISRMAQGWSQASRGLKYGVVGVGALWLAALVAASFSLSSVKPVASDYNSPKPVFTAAPTAFPTPEITPVPTPIPTPEESLMPTPSPTLEGIIIKELDSAPKEASQLSEQIYKYLEISPKSEYNRNAETKIPFKVEKSWLKTNNISESDVSYKKLISGNWVELPIHKTSEDSEYVYYEAVTPGFSTFAITGKSQPTPTPSPEPSPTPASGITEKLQDGYEVKKEGPKEQSQRTELKIKVAKGDSFSRIARAILGYENKRRFTHEELRALKGLVSNLHKDNPYSQTNINYVPEGATMTISLEGYAGAEAKLASRLVESPSLEARTEAKQETGSKRTIEGKVAEKKVPKLVVEWRKTSANEPCYHNRSIEEIRSMKMKPLCSYFSVNDYKNMNVYGHANEKILAGWDAYSSNGDVSALQNAIQDSLGVLYRGKDNRLRRRTEIEGKPGKFKDVYFKEEQARGIVDALEANIRFYFEASAEARGSTLAPGPKQDGKLLYDGNSALSTLHVLRAQKGL